MEYRVRQTPMTFLYIKYEYGSKFNVFLKIFFESTLGNLTSTNNFVDFFKK